MSKKRPWYPNYFEDYARDTGHLTWLEDLAYRRLLDAYYANGGPLPTDQKQLHRLCRASTRLERLAVDTVACSFFDAASGTSLRNARADVEIAKMAHVSQVRRNVALQLHLQKDLQTQVQLEVQKRPTAETTDTEVKNNNKISVSSSETHTKKSIGGIEFVGSQPKNRPRAAPHAHIIGKRWPVDAVIPAEWIVDGHQVRERAGLTRADLEAEAEAFVDYWKAQPGARGVKLDWKATWRTWCRRANGQSGRGVRARTQVNRIELARQALEINLGIGGAGGDGDGAARGDGFDDV